jgi:rRNA maturation endonuclease Nob1
MDLESPKTCEIPGSPSKEKPKQRCPVCGAQLFRNSMRKHSKTKKHLDAVYIMQDRFEIK